MLKEIVANQFKKPNGILGFIASKLMDKGNIKAIDWIFSLLNIKDKENILEIGYGSGILINKLAGLNKKIKIFGIDFSKVMFKRANKLNKKYIENSSVKLSCADILNYNEEGILFDKIIAINVIYFWNDLKLYLGKIYKLLNKSGKIFFYMSDPEELQKIKFTKTSVFNKYTTDDVVKELKNLKYKKITFETNKDNFIKSYCIIAEK